MEVRGFVTVIDAVPRAKSIDATISSVPTAKIFTNPLLPLLLLTVATEVSKELQVADCVMSWVDPSL